MDPDIIDVGGAMGGSNNPWENRQETGIPKALLETIKMVLFHTDDFFRDHQVRPQYGDPFLFYFLINAAVQAVAFAVGLVVAPNSIPAMKGISPVVMFAVSLVLVAAGIFISAAVFHLFVRLFGGRGGFKGTFDVLAYAGATGIVSVVPVIGGLIAGIWAVIITIKGFVRVHDMSVGRAALAYLLLPLIFLVAAVAIPNFYRAKVSADAALARQTLRSLSLAAESYTVNKGGQYPQSITDLTGANPPYINENPCGREVGGYEIGCNFRSDGYRFSAKPLDPGQGEEMDITTDGVISWKPGELPEFQ